MIRIAFSCEIVPSVLRSNPLNYLRMESFRQKNVLNKIYFTRTKTRLYEDLKSVQDTHFDRQITAYITNAIFPTQTATKNVENLTENEDKHGGLVIILIY